MNNASEARISALDSVLDGATATATENLGEDLFGVADILGAQATLRRTLSDPGMPEAARVKLAEELFGGKIDPAALAVLTQATRLRWSSPGSFLTAMERQGARAVLSAADAIGDLDTVEDQLFKVERLVAGSPELLGALTDRRVPLSGRVELLDGLLAQAVLPATRRLAVRAVAAVERPFGPTIEGYLELAAALKRRTIATVVVAAPLEAGQLARLEAILIKQTGRAVQVRVVVDPDVLGGVRVSIGDELIEGTVSARLADAHRKLG
ncbi:MAG: F0F1 ATP synthase subunit delta [Propioniciclava sp.]